MTTIYDLMLDVPLFRGMTRREFIEMAEKIRFDFYSCHRGDVIVEIDQPCDALIFVLRGDFCLERESVGRNYRLIEWRPAPEVVQPERLFGLVNRYACRAVAQSHVVQLLRIEKRAVVEWLFDSEVFRFNFLNQISTQAQQGFRRPWRGGHNDLQARFVSFVADRCTWLSGRKELRIGMVDLAEELCTTRLRVSKMLRALETEGKVVLGRERIQIPALEKIL